MNILFTNIFVALLFFLSNFILYYFNCSSFLLSNHFIIIEGKWNVLILFLSFVIILYLLVILLKNVFIKLNKVRYYFVFSLINSIILLFILMNFTNFKQILTLDNVLSVIFSTFLTTYAFFYSFYYYFLLEYKRNH